MNSIKQFFAMFLLVAFAAVSSTNTAAAQTANPKAEFVLKANEVDSMVALLLPAIQKVREAAARSFVIVLKNTQVLTTKVARAGSNMSNSQYQGFQRELETLEGQLNQFANGTSPASGEPAPGTVGACHKSCHDAFGDGFGGGKGWNRFVCKIGCIKVNFPGGGSAGG